MKHKNKIHYSAIWQNGKVIEVIADTSWIALSQRTIKAYLSLPADLETYATNCNAEQKIGDTVLSHDAYSSGDSIENFKFDF